MNDVSTKSLVVLSVKNALLALLVLWMIRSSHGGGFWSNVWKLIGMAILLFLVFMIIDLILDSKMKNLISKG